MDTELVGSWTIIYGRAEADEVCERIRWLTASYLKRIASRKEWGDWEVLFQDPDDNRFWELTYPQTEMHGGGPPRLTLISETEAEQKYRFR